MTVCTPLAPMLSPDFACLPRLCLPGLMHNNPAPYKAGVRMFGDASFTCQRLSAETEAMDDSSLEPRPSSQPGERPTTRPGAIAARPEHAVVVAGEAAREMCDTLGRATREGF